MASRPKKNSFSDVDKWIKNETPEKQSILEKASQHFENTKNLDVNTLKSVYGQESSFGENRGSPGSSRAAGDFQLEKRKAEERGLSVSKTNDERFNLEKVAPVAAQYLKELDGKFSKPTNLGNKLKTTPVTDPDERKKFAVAAYNAGEGRIAKAQGRAKLKGKDPTRWDEVKDYLGAAGADKEKIKEIKKYVEKVTGYEAEFSKKSNLKYTEKKSAENLDGHWVTIRGRPIFIKDKK